MARHPAPFLTRPAIVAPALLSLLALAGCPFDDNGHRPQDGPAPTSPAADRRTEPLTGARTEGPRRQFIAFLVDGTSFAEKYWQPSLETAARIFRICATPQAVVSVILIDNSSYEDTNELLGPLVMPSNKLKMVPELREVSAAIGALEAPTEVLPGTDIQGALHLLADQLKKHPDYWLNLCVFSDLLEDLQPVGKLEEGVVLPLNTRLTCLFVVRDKKGGEKEYAKRRQDWVALMSQYGVPDAQVEFRTVSESRVENLTERYIRSLGRPPNAGASAAAPTPSPAEERTEGHRPSSGASDAEVPFPPVPQALPVGAAGAPRAQPGTKKAQLPPFSETLQGANEVRIRNPNSCEVHAGIRQGNRGCDLRIGANGVTSGYVPDGGFQIYFVYSDRPDALFKGDDFELGGNGVEIKLVKVVGGNYGIQRVN